MEWDSVACKSYTGVQQAYYQLLGEVILNTEVSNRDDERRLQQRIDLAGLGIRFHNQFFGRLDILIEKVYRTLLQVFDNLPGISDI